MADEVNIKECDVCLGANEHGEEMVCSHPWCPNRSLWNEKRKISQIQTQEKE